MIRIITDDDPYAAAYEPYTVHSIEQDFASEWSRHDAQNDALRAAADYARNNPDSAYGFEVRKGHLLVRSGTRPEHFLGS